MFTCYNVFTFKMINGGIDWNMKFYYAEYDELAQVQQLIYMI